MVILVTILIPMSVAHMEICRGMMVVGGWVIWLMVVGGWMIGLVMIWLRMIVLVMMIRLMVRLWMIGLVVIRVYMMRLVVIRVYMMRLRVVDAVVAGQGAEAMKLRAVSMNFPKKSKVRPG